MRYVYRNLYYISILILCYDLADRVHFAIRRFDFSLCCIKKHMPIGDDISILTDEKSASLT